MWKIWPNVYFLPNFEHKHLKTFSPKNSSGTDGKEGTTVNHHLNFSKHDDKRTGEQTEAQVRTKHLTKQRRWSGFVTNSDSDHKGRIWHLCEMRKQKRREKLAPGMRGNPGAPPRSGFTSSPVPCLWTSAAPCVCFIILFFYSKGVTLTDLQEAEKTIQTMKTDNKGREKNEEEEKEKEAKQKKADEGVRTLWDGYRPVWLCRSCFCDLATLKLCVYRKWAGDLVLPACRSRTCWVSLSLLARLVRWHLKEKVVTSSVPSKSILHSQSLMHFIGISYDRPMERIQLWSGRNIMTNKKQIFSPFSLQYLFFIFIQLNRICLHYS